MKFCIWDCDHYKVCGIRKVMRKLINKYGFISENRSITEICKYFKEKEREEK